MMPMPDRSLAIQSRLNGKGEAYGRSARDPLGQEAPVAFERGTPAPFV